MSPIPSLFEREIEDGYVRDNFRKLREFMVAETPFLGFRFFEVQFDQAMTDFDFPHKLGFAPTDVILSFVSNGATLSWGYDNFTRDAIRMTVSAACKARFLVGSFNGAKR